jgi:cytochrome c oxidase subunit 4
METASPTHGRVPEEPHGVSVPHPEHKVNYLVIFITLVVLTVVTVAIAFKRFDNELVNVLLALLVASVKAMFVATYFMHLKFEGKLIYCIFFIPLVLTVILICAIIPDVGRGIHHIMHMPPIVKHDAEPLSPY